MFTLTIETDNAAFDGRAATLEISRLLSRLASDVHIGGGLSPDGEEGKLRDVNGNTVGTWTYTPSED